MIQQGTTKSRKDTAEILSYQKAAKHDMETLGHIRKGFQSDEPGIMDDETFIAVINKALKQGEQPYFLDYLKGIRDIQGPLHTTQTVALSFYFMKYTKRSHLSNFWGDMTTCQMMNWTLHPGWMAIVMFQCLYEEQAELVRQRLSATEEPTMFVLKFDGHVHLPTEYIIGRMRARLRRIRPEKRISLRNGPVTTVSQAT